MSWDVFRGKPSDSAGSSYEESAVSREASAGMDAQVDATLAAFRSIAIPAGMQARLHQRLVAELANSPALQHARADAEIDAALQAIGQVRPSQFLKDRLRTRLSRQPITSGDKIGVRGWAPWAALGAVATGLVLTVAIHPHTPAPAASAPSVIAAQPRPEVHPAFTPAQRTGRGAALNTNGVVATAKSHVQHSREAAIDAKNTQRRRPVALAHSTPPPRPAP